MRLHALSLAAVVLLGCAGATEEPSPLGGDESSATGSARTKKSASDGALTPEAPGKGDIDTEAPVATTTSSTATKSAPKDGATVLLDGVAQTVTSIAMWSPDADGDAYFFIRFNGKGAPDGTDVILTFTKVATGCVASPKAHPQDVWFRPPATGDQYHSVDGTSCGLAITSFPTAVGDFLQGTFDGKLAGINGASGKTHTLSLAFAYRRAD